jgi:acyl-CoA thioester hydrolase
MCLPAGLRRMELRAAPGEDDASGWKATVADSLGHPPNPFGLGLDRRACELSGHGEERSYHARMDGYRYVFAQEVAFRDLDAFGHVNNGVYLTYIENARIGYARDVIGIESLDGLLMIVASVKIDFRSRANLGDTLEIGARTTRVGTKSFDLEHEIRAQDGRLVAEAQTTLVAFDYDADQTMPIPPEWRERIENYESRSAAAT